MAEDTNGTSAHPISTKVILCVDENDAILRFEKTLLERSGYAALTAASAQQALEYVTMCEIDAVLLDYGMPEMDGYDIALEIRRVKPELIIILLSGGDVPTSALALVNAFIFKLETSRALLPMIADLCSQTRYSNQKQQAFERQETSWQNVSRT